jgi:hypothetical protein
MTKQQAYLAALGDPLARRYPSSEPERVEPVADALTTVEGQALERAYGAPAGFRWLTEIDRRRELDRRAEQRGRDRRRGSRLEILPDGRAVLVAPAYEQERIRRELERDGMLGG